MTWTISELLQKKKKKEKETMVRIEQQMGCKLQVHRPHRQNKLIKNTDQQHESITQKKQDKEKNTGETHINNGDDELGTRIWSHEVALQ